MALIGGIALVVAIFSQVVSVFCLLLGQMWGRSVAKQAIASRQQAAERCESINFFGHLTVIVSLAALSLASAVLLVCFFSGDVSLEYVVQNRSNASGLEGVLYKISGLWSGRSGSLLFWSWLTSIFAAVIAIKNLKQLQPLHNMALFVVQLVQIAFLGVMLFSAGNMPFVPLGAEHFDAAGNLTGAAAAWGMNTLLEHWAMVIHPPTLFIGYAGLTIPFAYAISALIINDDSSQWVNNAVRYALISWLFLGVGIGLGAIWAYVVLGWGGYWGWDPVENASLLSWILAVGLIHSFTVYRQRGLFKRWSVLCACLTFALVIVGTFISRSGIVQSVHAFEEDPASLILFLSLIIISVLAGAVGLLLRRNSFTDKGGGQGSKDGDAGEFSENSESLFSKSVAYFFTNVILAVCAAVLLYLTVASALPAWLPMGGLALSAPTFNAIARPLGIIFCLIMAVCPLLAWNKTSRADFIKQARIPGVLALVVFVLLVVYFVTYLLPSYNSIVAAGGSTAAGVLNSGPAFYYFLLTLLGFLAASLLFFNSMYILVSLVRSHKKAKDLALPVAFFSAIKNQPARFGGFLAHAAMGIILLGLIGSAMYVTEVVGYIKYDIESDTAQNEFVIQDYRLSYVSNNIDFQDNEDDIVYQVSFDVYKGDAYLGQVSPAIQLVQSTQQRKLVASVVSSPLQDLFVVYNGVNEDGAFSLDVRVNPLIMFVWLGFALLMVGTAIAALGKRKPR